MLNRWAKALLQTAMLCGLCAYASANTTMQGNPDDADVGQAQVPVQQQIRIALLLPTRSSVLGAAADAVRAGFMAAYEREKDGVAVTLVETDDTAQNVLTGYQTASAQNDIVVGPLSRSGVAAVAQRGAVSKPTLALAEPDTSGDADVNLPSRMLVMGLSMEEEARQIADWASFDKTATKALVVSTRTPWQRRAAQAFIAQWTHLGFKAEAVDINASEGYLNANRLNQLKKKLDPEQPVVVFAALDAWQARQLRDALGNQVPMYGTSQINPVAVEDRSTTEPAENMDGTHLLDIPWQLEPDNPAVMSYPRPVVDADQKRNADMERLYALGIDAYRVARELAQRRTNFELDGVTGKLSVRFDSIGASFGRTAQQAIYRDGIVVVDTDTVARTQ